MSKAVPSFKGYYKGKNMIGRYIIIALILLLVIIQFMIPKNKDHVPEEEYQTSVIDRYVFGFAGQDIPLEDEYFLNQSRLDREVAITFINMPQIMMVHKRQSLYFPIIEEILKENSIPDDFKYMAVAESALRIDAYSTAGAAGIWQFMPSTARGYGLIVDEYVDERYDFAKSTVAAAEYLGELYDEFGDWTLVAAAYNRGENGIARDLLTQQQDSYYDLHLNSETSRFVFRIVAWKYILENKDVLLDLTILGQQYVWPDFDYVKILEVEDIVDWSIDQGYSYKSIRELNPWIVGSKLPEDQEKWIIRVLER